MASSRVISFSYIRELKQARTATCSINKQRNFTVEKKPYTTDYIHILHIRRLFYDFKCGRVVWRRVIYSRRDAKKGTGSCIAVS